ncbi:hypothetical protein HYDPIDRAFT_105019 [Hydnomerulius pinastri MD-312]|nr:hypothetical protein HYDPIDRAFT_105019 [Hydnomerulius pinastri MD-312]
MSPETPTTLKHLCVSEDSWPIGENPALTMDHFRPLLKLRNLKHIELDVQCTISLDDAGLAEVAKAWPSLERLYLNYEGWTIPSGITFGGFTDFLMDCPNMAELGIVVDFSFVPDDLLVGPFINTIERRDAGNSPVSRPAALGAYLGHIMPKLKEIQAWNLQREEGPEAEGTYQTWRRVVDRSDGQLGWPYIVTCNFITDKRSRVAAADRH